VLKGGAVRPPVLNAEAMETAALKVTLRVTSIVDGFASTAVFCLHKCASLHLPPVQNGPPSFERESL